MVILLLKNKSEQNQNDVDIAVCKKQPYYVVILNQKSKCNYFDSLGINKGAKPF